MENDKWIISHIIWIPDELCDSWPVNSTRNTDMYVLLRYLIWLFSVLT